MKVIGINLYKSRCKNFHSEKAKVFQKKRYSFDNKIKLLSMSHLSLKGKDKNDNFLSRGKTLLKCD